MIRVWHILWVAVFVALVIALFQVKYTVQQVRERRDASVVQIDATKERIRKLKLEWEQLNQPRRLTSLSRDFIPEFDPEYAGAIQPVDQLPYRPENLRPVAYLTIEEPDSYGAEIIMPEGETTRDIGSLRPIHSPDILGSIIAQHADNFSVGE